MHSYDFVVQFVVAVGRRKKRVAVRYEHVEQVHYLGRETHEHGQLNHSNKKGPNEMMTQPINLSDTVEINRKGSSYIKRFVCVS